MNQPTFKSEGKPAKPAKKEKPVITPKTPGGWAMLNLIGSMKEVHEREPRRLPK